MALLPCSLPSYLHGHLGVQFGAVGCQVKWWRASVIRNVRTQHRELELEETKVMLHGRQLTIFQPKEVDEVLEMYIEQDRLDRDPYWCRLWPSALALAEKILAHPELVYGCRVCDLGAGLGLAGLAAALVGAREVVLYDREVQALFCALLNIHANISDASTNLPQIMNLITASIENKPATSLRARAPVPQQLLHSAYIDLAKKFIKFPLGEGWGNPSLHKPSVRAEMFDWTNKPAEGLDFDVVLACDVLYEKPAVSVIADLVPQLLQKRAGSRLLIADPVERNPKNRDLFVQLFGSRSTDNFMRLDAREECIPFMDGRPHQVELLSFTWKVDGEKQLTALKVREGDAMAN